MTKPKPADELRFCTVSNGNCLAPAGYGISGVGTCDGDKGTQGTCFSCWQPVCGSPGCSQRMRWKKFGRKRICKNCYDPEEEQRRMEGEKQTVVTMEIPQEGLDRMWQKVQERDPKVAAMFRQFKVRKFGAWNIDATGFLVKD